LEREKIYIDYFDSFIGTLKITADEKYLLDIKISDNEKLSNPNEITEITKIWLKNYFDKKEPIWIPPLRPFKTRFSQKVINEVLNIPFAKCKSYSEIAKNIGNPKAYRAVASVMKNNPYIIIVPCHRVIAKESLGGYNEGVEIKRKLLEFEECELTNF